jgi:hypothetical protein
MVSEGPALDINGIAALHRDIFLPTCANSGCHDGTFEPDFRSIESSYNTLLYHPVIKNNPAGDYNYRVVPGMPNQSVLWNRVTVDIDGQSGIMPLALEPDSDWEENKSEYLNRLRSWIEAGAKDMFGNSPQSGDIQPTAKGMVAFLPGSSDPLPRESGKRSIVVPAGTSRIDLWISLSDDNTAAFDLGDPRLFMSEDQNNFTGARQENLGIAPAIQAEGYLEPQVDYFHKVSLGLSAYPRDTRVFFRISVQDPNHSARTVIPGEGANSYVKRYFSIIMK